MSLALAGLTRKVKYEHRIHPEKVLALTLQKLDDDLQRTVDDDGGFVSVDGLESCVC